MNLDCLCVTNRNVQFFNVQNHEDIDKLSLLYGIRSDRHRVVATVIGTAIVIGRYKLFF